HRMRGEGQGEGSFRARRVLIQWQWGRGEGDGSGRRSVDRKSQRSWNSALVAARLIDARPAAAWFAVVIMLAGMVTAAEDSRPLSPQAAERGEQGPRRVFKDRITPH